MRFGIFAMPEHPPREHVTLSFDRDIDNIVLAEKLGFDEFWIGEHHTGGFETVPNCEYMIAKASALTHRIRLGTGMVQLPYHDPFLVAERLAFLDHLTHGRLEYGFGGGGLPTDKALFQMAPESLAARTNEALEIIWKLLTSNEPVTYKGQYWQYEKRQIQIGPFQEKPPFAIAGLTGNHNYALCGSRGWNPLSVYFSPLKVTTNPVPDLGSHAKAMTEAASKAGLDPVQARANWRVSREVYVSDNKNQAMNEIREGVKLSYEYLLGLGLGALMKPTPEITDADLTFEWMVDNLPWVIGSPDDCIRQINEIHEQTGGFGTLLINARDWVTTDKWNRSLEMFSRYVMPRFQSNQFLKRRLALADVALGKTK